MRRFPTHWMIATGLALGMGACSSNAPSPQAHSSEDQDSSANESAAHQLGRGEDVPPYPADWQVDVAEAVGGATFAVYLPSTSEANPSNPVAAYLWPDKTAVAIDFPPPAETTDQLSQSYLEIYETAWTGGDPLKDYQRDIELDPISGKSIIQLNDTPALGVEARSPDDANMANAAFLRFVVNGVEVQVSGGESLELLIKIANTVISSATSTKG